MSIAAGFVEAARRTAETYGVTALQFFCKSPRGRGTTKLTAEEAALFRDYASKHDVRFVVAHGSYLVNLAKPLDARDPWPLDSLVEDLRSIELLGGVGVVLHTGKTLDQDYETAEAHLAENLKSVLSETDGLRAHILLENMSGQGTEMGVTFEQLRSLLERLEWPERVSVCFDTCHAFAAGYDLRTPAAIDAVMSEFDRLIGLDRLTLFHFNDSKKGLGEHRDRHEVLEAGAIGDGLRHLANWAVSHNVPMILETPETAARGHDVDLAILKGWLSA